ncbi:Uncharacterised protein [Burkholderia pseudomallei]|nr:Uncharacterised protein [Burkholderia pseudomallei]
MHPTFRHFICRQSARIDGHFLHAEHAAKHLIRRRPFSATSEEGIPISPPSPAPPETVTAPPFFENVAIDNDTPCIAASTDTPSPSTPPRTARRRQPSEHPSGVIEQPPPKTAATLFLPPITCSYPHAYQLRQSQRARARCGSRQASHKRTHRSMKPRATQLESRRRRARMPPRIAPLCTLGRRCASNTQAVHRRHPCFESENEAEIRERSRTRK